MARFPARTLQWEPRAAYWRILALDVSMRTTKPNRVPARSGTWLRCPSWWVLHQRDSACGHATNRPGFPGGVLLAQLACAWHRSHHGASTHDAFGGSRPRLPLYTEAKSDTAALLMIYGATPVTPPRNQIRLQRRRLHSIGTPCTASHRPTTRSVFGRERVWTAQAAGHAVPTATRVAAAYRAH